MTVLTARIMREIFAECAEEAGVTVDDLLCRRPRHAGIERVRARAFLLAATKTGATNGAISKVSGFSRSEVSQALARTRAEIRSRNERMAFLYGIETPMDRALRQAADHGAWRRLGRPKDGAAA